MKMLSALLVALALCVGCSFEVAAEELDGSQWKVRYKGSNSVMPFWNRDTVSFEKGRFRSSDALPNGFQPAPYETKKNGDTLTWYSTQTNPDGERLQWEGSKIGDKMEGSFTRTEPDGKAREYRFIAELQRLKEDSR
ncbi:MAG: hypothetical protein HY549_12530 [Elusimicrobia bacterium]|nr:hypothetical protein [Elusimicrobiota bacterium]